MSSSSESSLRWSDLTEAEQSAWLSAVADAERDTPDELDSIWEDVLKPTTAFDRAKVPFRAMKGLSLSLVFTVTHNVPPSSPIALFDPVAELGERRFRRRARNLLAKHAKDDFVIDDFAWPNGWTWLAHEISGREIPD